MFNSNQHHEPASILAKCELRRYMPGFNGAIYHIDGKPFQILDPIWGITKLKMLNLFNFMILSNHGQ